MKTKPILAAVERVTCGRQASGAAAAAAAAKGRLGPLLEATDCAGGGPSDGTGGRRG